MTLLVMISASAGEVDVINATAECSPTCRFSVTLRHADSGWDHYANLWQVLSVDGDVLATRELAHPHVNEQPFTRSLGNVTLPEGTEKVIIRATDSVHGTGGKAFELSITP